MKEAIECLTYKGIHKGERKLKAYGKALEELARNNDDIVCLTADLTSILEADFFRDSFPRRFFEMGMAEQNMVGVAAGLAQGGEIPFAHTFACFLTRKCYDQIVNSVAYPNLNVKLVGMMPGISSVGGASHQATDDLALMRAIPNMNIIDLADATESAQAVKVAYETEGPVYLRIRRGELPVLFNPNQYQLELGQSYLLKKGSDIGIITSGLMTEHALAAASILEENGVSTNILHVPSIKPLDTDGILEVISRSKAIITLDNHSVIGGLGSAVSEVIAENTVAIPFRRLGLQDQFGKAASMPYLSRLFGLEPDQIAESAMSLLEGSKAIHVSTNWKRSTEQVSGWGEEWKN